MILTATDDGDLEVIELRDDGAGAPLLAKASGAVALGDAVVAINDRVLARYGPASLQSAAAEMRAAPRPVRVLFKRGDGRAKTAA